MMRKKILIGLAAIIVVAAFAVVLGLLPAKKSAKVSESAPAKKSASQPLQLEYYFPHQFNEAQEKAKTLGGEFPAGRVRAGIIPHDIRQGQFMAHFFSGVKLPQYSTIVLIGPNHYETGGSDLISSTKDWQTPFGLLQANSQVINSLKDNGYLALNDSVIQHEHSVAGIIPYIAHDTTKIRVVPIILKHEVTVLQIDQLISDLDSLLPPDSLIVAPVDFSHYLPSKQASENDKITEQALLKFDDNRIMSFGVNFNDYVDSPSSVAFLLRWAKKYGATHVDILNHTNSGILSGDLSEPSTSFFEVAYY